VTLDGAGDGAAGGLHQGRAGLPAVSRFLVGVGSSGLG